MSTLSYPGIVDNGCFPGQLQSVCHASEGAMTVKIVDIKERL